MKQEISLIPCLDYEPAAVERAVGAAIASLGGITRFIRPGSRVLVKPNLLMAKPPEAAVTTHPEVVAALVRQIKGIGCQVFIGDGPSAFGNQVRNIDGLYEKTGMARVARETGAELVVFDRGRWRGDFPLSTWLDRCDHYVSVPKFKTHELLILTAAIKNSFGLLTGNHKTQLHMRYFDVDKFARIVVEIYRQARPCLSLVDAVVAMEGEGPGSSGTPRQCGFILAGSDAVALDSVLAMMMGLSPRDILTTKEAALQGLGCMDLDNIDIKGARIEEAVNAPFKLPTTSAVRRIPRPVVNLAKRLVRYYPCVEHGRCIGCAACVAACPKKIMRLKKGRISIDYRHCIACFCCQEACPAAAIKVKKSLVARLTGL